ncbi:MAG: TRAP transporter small permease subunit [Candidatus Latescibacterota bacterium]|nr:TRAP transporter small permease subunit [Candidatus Latescibacterota bacterium]
MVIISFVIVVLRYLFERGWVWMQELVVYLHAFSFLLAAGHTLAHDEHVRVDIFYRNSNIRSKALVDLIGSVFLLLPVCIVLAYLSVPYVIASWNVWEGSKDGGGLEAVFLLKTAIPLFCFFLGLQGISLALKSYNTLREKI